MIYNDFHGESLSMQGFGAMRLPQLENGEIDQAQLQEMVDSAIAGGVNYFDTAWPYHGGKSETALAKALSKYPREKWNLADKFPGHQISESYDPAAIFERQLEKCGVAYFDFYLLHNVYEKSMHTYLDPQWGIIDYFLKQKRLGRIRHLGFSTHGRLDCMKEFLERCGSDMEFCQIQLNYLDWTLQDAKAKCALLAQYGIPVWVMEPLRGGRLTKLTDEQMAKLGALRPDVSAQEWAFDFLQSLPNVTVVLSGMSAAGQMRDNLRIFENRRPLSETEQAALLEIAEDMKQSLPCTGCRYCCDGCPMGLDIPKLISYYNELRFSSSFNVSMGVEALPEDKRPNACIGCGACAQICPQQIDVPAAMADLADRLSKMPSWAQICRERDEAQRRSEGKA